MKGENNEEPLHSINGHLIHSPLTAIGNNIHDCIVVKYKILPLILNT
jgi:hypothetical protein